MTSVGKDVENLESLCIIGGDGKWYSHHGKQCDSSSKMKSLEDLAMSSGDIPQIIENRVWIRYLYTHAHHTNIANIQVEENQYP